MARKKDDMAARLKKAEAENRKLKDEIRKTNDEWTKKYDDLKKQRDAEIQVMSDCLEAARGGADINITNMIDSITKDETRLRAMTGSTCDQFRIISEDLRFWITNTCGDVRLKRDDWAPEQGVPGNRCKLLVEEAQFLTQYRMKTGDAQEVIGGLFGISQETVSRYLEEFEPLIQGILVGPHNIAKHVARGLPSWVMRQVFPGRKLYPDGTFTASVRPVDEEERKARHSGKAKMPAWNTMPAINARGIIVWLSKTHPGRTHDIKIIGELEHMLPSTGSKNTPYKYRIIIFADRGFIGTEKYLSGVIVITPHKRKKGRKLTRQQKRENKLHSRERAPSEHVNHRIKVFRQVGIGKYRGSGEELNVEIDIAAGLANMHLLYKQFKRKSGAFYEIKRRVFRDHRRERLILSEQYEKRGCAGRIGRP